MSAVADAVKRAPEAYKAIVAALTTVAGAEGTILLWSDHLPAGWIQGVVGAFGFAAGALTFLKRNKNNIDLAEKLIQEYLDAVADPAVPNPTKVPAQVEAIHEVIKQNPDLVAELIAHYKQTH